MDVLDLVRARREPSGEARLPARIAIGKRRRVDSDGPMARIEGGAASGLADFFTDDDAGARPHSDDRNPPRGLRVRDGGFHLAAGRIRRAARTNAGKESGVVADECGALSHYCSCCTITSIGGSSWARVSLSAVFWAI